MELIFNDYGIEIYRQESRFFLTYDAGHFTIEYKTIEISQEEAIKAQESGKAAYRIIIHHQNIEMFGEDYMNR